MENSATAVYERLESAVRSYCRACPAEFDRASGSYLFDVSGRAYLDFIAGCGALNYGHNEPSMKAALLDYVAGDGVSMTLDFHSRAKTEFLRAFDRCVLRPRGLDYRLQFTGPTGSNAVEAALKLARKKTGRSRVVAFTNGFHGVSLGALAATGNGHHRGAFESQLHDVHRAAYDGYLGPDLDTAEMLDRMLSDPSGGIGPIAAVLFEPIQGEGGLNCASPEWAQRVCAVARRHGALVIVDEIQSGCGRSGDFFAFEGLGIEPDVVTLAKSLSGAGLPMSMVLLAPELDAWSPGEHNGTFRGNAHAFVTARAALETFWSDDAFASDVRRKAAVLRRRLDVLAAETGGRVKGRGLMSGLDVGDGDVAQAIRAGCLEEGLLLELCGPHDEVVKLLVPLTIADADLDRGLSILESVVRTRVPPRRVSPARSIEAPEPVLS
ncbi:aspartate aminotransferase family protein [Salinarimonas sp.]|uniref:aspartate aminotransferase family protein n=1 Tax=Salinarimonas sp. TaxID=2766526 RepID=UPI0032D9354E